MAAILIVVLGVTMIYSLGYNTPFFGRKRNRYAEMVNEMRAEGILSTVPVGKRNDHESQRESIAEEFGNYLDHLPTE